jgi:hypothetical protein
MTVTTDSLDGMFKIRYADKLEKLVPSFNKLARDISFQNAKRLGASYRFPVSLRRSAGVTYAGGSDYGTAFSLNAASSGLTKEASLTGTEFVLRESISYGAVAASRGGNMAAFGNAFDRTVVDMTESAAFHREMALFYGGTNIGSVTGTPNQPTATTAELIITLADWAPGLWSQMEGAKLDVYSSDGATLRNDSSGTAVYTVTNVDSATRTVTVSGEATDIDAIADTDIIRPAGSTDAVFDGIDSICTNTGTLFGIDASTYGLWQANTYAAGSAALTMAKINAAAAQMVPRGGMRDLTCYVSTATWSDLNDDLAAARRFVNTMKGGADLGTRGDDNSIRFYGPSGEVKLVPHPLCKQGEAFLLDPRCFKRIGATDTTFDLGIEGQQNRFFRELADSAGFELRCYWNQGLICEKPNAQTKITGIVNG